MRAKKKEAEGRASAERLVCRRGSGVSGGVVGAVWAASKQGVSHVLSREEEEIYVHDKKKVNIQRIISWNLCPFKLRRNNNQ